MQYDELYPFHEGLAFVKKGEKVGFIDKTGKEVVPVQYDDDEDYYMELSHPPFFENKIVSLNKNGKAVLVDNTGKELNLKQYDESSYYWFSEGLTTVQQNGKWGFIDFLELIVKEVLSRTICTGEDIVIQKLFFFNSQRISIEQFF